jgi:hypothetical protein
MIQTANRLHSVEEYYFSRKLREVRQLISEGKPIINMRSSRIWPRYIGNSSNSEIII